MVHSGSLRFDFSHFSKLTDEELLEVQDFINARIKEELPLEEKRNIPYQQALIKELLPFLEKSMVMQ
jgi:alanyl-tRNA synthetase